MHHPVHISIVISSRNGARRLPATLDALLAQQCAHLRFELIVVDNNSTDRTAAVIDRYVRIAPDRVRYLFEPEEGVSFGRNSGIRNASGAIVAFTDDDVIPAPDWIANIHRAFREHLEVDYVSGKIVPQYERTPPRWLTRANAGPCVLRDRGDTPLFSEPGCFFPGWATANIAFRRQVFDRIGLFSGEFPRGQDLEFIVRLWRVGGRGMYAPDVVVTHRVPADRMTKAYHRMWHRREGDIRARIRFREIFDKHDRVVDEGVAERTAVRVPAFLYRELGCACLLWAAAALRRDEALALRHECRARQTLSYIRTRRRHAAPAFFRLSPERVVELGVQVEM